MMAYPQFSALETHYPSPRCHLLQLRSEEARKDNGLVSLEPSSLSCGNIVETGAHMCTNPFGGSGTVLGRQIDSGAGGAALLIDVVARACRLPSLPRCAASRHPPRGYIYTPLRGKLSWYEHSSSSGRIQMSVTSGTLQTSLCAGVWRVWSIDFAIGKGEDRRFGRSVGRYSAFPV